MVEIPILEDVLPLAAAPHALPVDLVCTNCGYGVAAPHVPDGCPMCRNDAWEPAVWRPFAAMLEVVEPHPEAR